MTHSRMGGRFAVDWEALRHGRALQKSFAGRIDSGSNLCESLKVEREKTMHQDEHVWLWVYVQLTRDADTESMLLKLAKCCW